MKEATLGAGCFWCIEAIYKEVQGIIEVLPGYCNGHLKNPTYKEVCTGQTGHVEVARVQYDESKISFADLLEVFFFVHDPTTLNRQGGDVGTQYRSGIYYHDEEQKGMALKYIQKLNEEKVWDKPIVTEVEPLSNYSEAEAYHHNYLELNPENPYCQSVVRPKVDKFKKVFAEKLKK